MKTLATIVITAACCCAAILATDLWRGIQKGVRERKEYVDYCDKYNVEQGTGVRISTSGFLADTISFDINGLSDAERDYLIAETIHGTESVEDYNFREALRRMHFKRIRVGNRTVDIPKAEPVGPRHGREEYEFADNLALKCTGFGAV